MYYLIYKITNQIDGKIYVGSHKTKNLNDGYMGSGKYLKRAQEKYGIENFTKEILFVYDNPEQMYEKEKEIVNENFLITENTYNLKIGGFGGWDYINSKSFVKNSSHFVYGNKQSILGGTKTFLEKKGIHSLESKKKAKEIQKNKYPNGTFYNKQHSNETKRIIGSKNSIKQSGEGNSQFGTRWIHSNELKLSKRISKTETLPDNWIEGRKIKYS
jgi:hypothetical protein